MIYTPLSQAKLEAAAFQAFQTQGEPTDVQRQALLVLFLAIHSDCVAAGWWSDLTTGQRKKRNFGELMALIWSEVCEAEAANGPDDKLPQYHGYPVEINDSLIRLCDVCGSGTFGDMKAIAGWAALTICQDDIMGQARNPISQLAISWAAVFELGRKEKNFEKEIGTLFGQLVLCAKDHFIDDGGVTAKIFAAKQAFNRQRADHKVENRVAEGGKKV